MKQVEDLLLDLVKEKGIVLIIMDYKHEMEVIDNKVYTSLDIIDQLILDFYLNNFRKSEVRLVS